MELAERARRINPSPTLTIDARAKEMRAAGMNVLNFGAGEPDFDTPEHIREAARQAIEQGMTRYTAVAGMPALKQVIQEKLKRENGLDYEPDQIVVSAGAKHSLYNAFQVLCQAGDEVILPSPYWVSYLEQIRLTDAEVRLVTTRAENGFKLTPGELAAALSPKSKVLVLNSPSNPTGAVYSRAELEALVPVILEAGLTVISDEIYEKLVYDDNEHVSIAALGPEIKERTVLINGVSKAYAITGWRLGYAAMPQAVARGMTRLQGHSTSNACSISQAAAIAALSGTQEPTARMVAEFAVRRTYMLERLAAIPGVSCFRPGGAFYLFPDVRAFWGAAYRGRPVTNATELAALLLDEVQVAVVPGIGFGDDNYIRLSYATDMETIREGMDRLAGLLGALK
ncbi:MAG: pyridoxal phosphate-dependent aminotransferase [Bacillota bacterium]